MKSTAALSTLALLAATATVVLAGPAVSAPAAVSVAADVATVTVTWPEATHVNPHEHPYEFTVTDNPTDAHLFYTWGWQDDQVWQIGPGTPLPASGSATVDFDGAQGHGAVRVWACPDVTWSTNCVEAARSPELDVYYEMTVVQTFGSPVVHSGVQHLPISYGPRPPDTDAPTGDWELLGPDLQQLDPVVGGALTAADLAIDPDTGDSTLAVTVPDGLPSATYYLDVHLSSESADYGHLTGSLAATMDGPAPIVIDNDAPRLKVRKISPTLYPVSDGYEDYLYVYAKADEWSTAHLEVTDSRGVRVYRSRGHQLNTVDYDWSDAPSWNGHRGGKIVPDGRYTVSLIVNDRVGNTSTWTSPVTVSHQHLQWTMFRRTVTAADSLTGKPYIGRCATLAKPAKGGPRGSLGFYSATKCHGTLASAGVATDHGMYIPQAFQNHYDWSQVVLNGGPATSAKGNYINLSYLRPHSKKLWNGKFFTTGHGAHAGLRYDGGNVFGKNTDRPYILWTNGATAGSRYDVRSYTVLVRYQALR